MRVGVTIPAYELSSRRPKTFAEMAEDAVRAEQLGYDSAWVMDHILVERDGRRRGAGPAVRAGYNDAPASAEEPLERIGARAGRILASPDHDHWTARILRAHDSERAGCAWSNDDDAGVVSL